MNHPPIRVSRRTVSTIIPPTTVVHITREGRSGSIRSEPDHAADRMLMDWAANRNNDARIEAAEEFVRGLGIDLAMRNARTNARRRSDAPA